jgi:hypothetical protein
MWPPADRGSNFQSSRIAEWESLSNNRVRFLKSAYILGGVPMDEDHARYLALQQNGFTHAIADIPGPRIVEVCATAVRQ